MKEWIRDILIAIVIALLITQVIKPTIVKENSMQATLYENNYLLLNKQAYLFSEPEYKDIVVFHSNLKTAEGKEKLLIKRIIGLPGDIITIEDGQVYKNGKALEEPYIKEPYTMGDTVLEVPEGFMFVMGDNRQHSADSRDPQIGCVEMNKIVGKAFVKLYPFNEMGLIH